MGRYGRGFLPIVVATLVMSGVTGCSANMKAARTERMDVDFRMPAIEGREIDLKTAKPSFSPGIPFSVVEEVPGRSPGAVSGTWITLIEVSFTAVDAGEPGNAGSAQGESNPSDGSE